MKILDNTQLVYALHAREKKSFSILYDRYAPALYAMVIKIVPDQDAANDIICQTFLKAYQNISSLKKDDSIFCWLLKYAVLCSRGLCVESELNELLVAARRGRTASKVIVSEMV
ncbi:MAG: sigma factor [Ferruginibacter sp.]